MKALLVSTSKAGNLTLEKRWVLVTGADGHIGKALSKNLAQQGYDLVLTDARQGALLSTALSLSTEFSVRVETKVADLELESDRANLIQAVLDISDSLYGVVNLAAFVGTSELDGWSGPLQEQSIDSWKRALEVNLTAPFHLVKGLEQALRRSQFSSVLNVSSIYGLYGPNPALYEDGEFRNPAAYAATKGGLIQLTRWLATYLAPDVRVNAIALGGLKRDQTDKFIDRYSSLTPLGRMATESDAVEAISFLLSQRASYITGETLSVDGGWGVW